MSKVHTLWRVANPDFRKNIYLCTHYSQWTYVNTTLENGDRFQNDTMARKVMCVCVCVWVCVCLCVCVTIRSDFGKWSSVAGSYYGAEGYVCICTYACMRVCVCVCLCLCLCVFVAIRSDFWKMVIGCRIILWRRNRMYCVCIYIYTYVYVYACICICVCMCM
jgi:hypothetical protein